MCVEDAYLCRDGPRPPASTSPSRCTTSSASRDLAPTWGEDSVDAGLAKDPEARLLEIAEGSPVLRVARRAVLRPHPVEVSRSTYRADRFTLWIPMSRQPTAHH